MGGAWDFQQAATYALIAALAGDRSELTAQLDRMDKDDLHALMEASEQLRRRAREAWLPKITISVNEEWDFEEAAAAHRDEGGENDDKVF